MKTKEAAPMFLFIEENTWGAKEQHSPSCCELRTVEEVVFDPVGIWKVHRVKGAQQDSKNCPEGNKQYEGKHA